MKWTVTASSPLDVLPAKENGACKACSLSCLHCKHIDWKSLCAAPPSEQPAESSAQPAESPAAADVAEPAAAPQIVVSMPLSPMVEPVEVGDYVQAPEDKSTLVKIAACTGIIQTIKKKSRALAISRAATSESGWCQRTSFLVLIPNWVNYSCSEAATWYGRSKTTRL